jgi:hypothetical protein
MSLWLATAPVQSSAWQNARLAVLHPTAVHPATCGWQARNLVAALLLAAGHAGRRHQHGQCTGHNSTAYLQTSPVCYAAPVSVLRFSSSCCTGCTGMGWW